jgi:tetratricopeptide (TPR) repeat protein
MRWKLRHTRFGFAIGMAACALALGAPSQAEEPPSPSAPAPPVATDDAPRALDDPAVVASDEPSATASDEAASNPAAVASDEPASQGATAPSDSSADSPKPDSGEPMPAESDAAAPGALPTDSKPSAPLAEPESKPDARPKLDPSSLEGVHPGTTTREELHKQWGKPERVMRIAGGARELYTLEKLGRAQVTLLENVVHSLTVRITEPLPAEALAGRLDLAGVEPVDIHDERGDMLGAAYPERGVLFAYVPKARQQRVFQVVIEAIEAAPFVSRAQSRLPERPADAQADVDVALRLAPDHAQAHHLQAEIALAHGKLDAALTAAQRAADLETQELSHRLLVARVLAASGDYPQAISRLRDVIDQSDVDDLVAATAYCQWGDCLAQSAQRNFTEAIEHHQRAIALAEPLVNHTSRAVRRQAKDLLLDAHLAVAYDVGWGNWQQKASFVPKWIERATFYAEDLLRNEHAGPKVRFRVYVGAVAAMAGVEAPPDASRWIKGLRQLGKSLYDDATDPTYRAGLCWQTACALSDAVEIELTRHNPEEAIVLGDLAQSLFAESAPVADALPIYNYRRGFACYRVGVVFAVERSNHARAVEWFNRAAPLLESPVPAAAVGCGTQGEAFVSMAVSYWNQSNSREALRLTNQGLKLMEQAVGEGSLEATALAVPYGNLAAMHEELGDQEQAKWCAELAARYEESAKK